MRTIGGRLGCAAVFLIVIVVSLPLLFGLAWSGAHCEPVPKCQRGSELYFAALLAGVAALAGIAGFLIRLAVNALAVRREDEGTSAGFLIAAAVVTLIVVGLAIGVAFAFLDRMSA
jgi:hypothetical protein